MEYILCLYLASPRMKPHHNGWMSPMSKYAITFVAVNQHIPFHLSQLLCCFWHLHHLYKCYNLHNPLLYYSTWFHLQMIQTQIKLIWAKTKKEEEYIVLCSEMLCSQSGTSCTQQVKCSHSLFNSHLCSLSLSLFGHHLNSRRLLTTHSTSSDLVNPGRLLKVLC